LKLIYFCTGLVIFIMKNKIAIFSIVILSFLAGYLVSINNADIKQETAHPTNMPILTTAGIVYYCPDNQIILIERGKAPFGYAMFGGHVEYESPEQAFKREAKEELNIDIENLELIGVYGNPGRDPRQHSVEVTYSATTNQKPHAGSDAKKTHLLTKAELEKELTKDLKDSKIKFAFDHADILRKYLNGNHDPCNK
jgi:8-oxo-dGTP diphosphatase